MSGINGWLILDKPLGLGSTDGVTAVKRALRAAGYDASKRGIKVGHGGTLDPLATGVLPMISPQADIVRRVIGPIASAAADFFLGFAQLGGL